MYYSLADSWKHILHVVSGKVTFASSLSFSFWRSSHDLFCPLESYICQHCNSSVFLVLFISQFHVKYFFLQNTHCVKSVQIRRFFCAVFSCIRTEYVDLRGKFPYSVRIQENTDQKNLRIWTLFTHWLLILSLPAKRDDSKVDDLN